MIGNFLVVFAASFITLVGGSIAWPKLTTAPRPILLQQVHDVALTTPQGKNVAQVLGVTDEANVEPISIGEVAGGLVNSAKNALAKRAQFIIVNQAVAQLSNRFNSLPKGEQEQIRQIICAPPAASPAGTVK